MGGEDSLNPVSFLKTLATAAGWIFTLVSAAEILVLPKLA